MPNGCIQSISMSHNAFMSVSMPIGSFTSVSMSNCSFMSIVSYGKETIKYYVSGCLKLINCLFIDGKREPPRIFVSRGLNASSEILIDVVDGVNKQKFYKPHVFFITTPPGIFRTGSLRTGLNVSEFCKITLIREINKWTRPSSSLIFIGRLCS